MPDDYGDLTCELTDLPNNVCGILHGHEGPDVLLNGVVDPSRFDDLATVLTRCGAGTYRLELYDEDGGLLREMRV
ncbi:hypothetical protein ACH4UX_30740 [Streptomyces althioticus]|uniref:DUF2249 domain-containing protein n=1 Tax=Streptomyces griseorubens TaxID=66897 RepID=A0ABR4SXW1_9ACTN|nr:MULTISPECIES: hypothetical protein [Actinomycetes]KEG40029.1 hypothetical protein DJ64_11500 [Streptomyces griseorubens]MCC9688242.1 hypothetical protein [Streptomyces sp. MNU103]WTC23095.1 hypothetical protein OG872_10570 [Streptomyces althioticus]